MERLPPKGPFRAGLVQLTTGRDVERNLASAAELVREAAAAGARFILTPEMTNILETDRERLKGSVQREEDDQAPRFFATLAHELGVHLLVGSMALRSDGDKLVNRSLLFSPEGAVMARYDKIHLFDVDVGTGQSYRESRTYGGGEEASTVDLPWGRFAPTICYDVRFPALYRLLSQAGALFVSVPSAFTKVTGAAHWHVLLRARAIENGMFVLAPAQTGHHESGRDTFGHTLAVDPWGTIIAERADEPGIVLVELDPELARSARRRIPALAHDRAWSLGDDR